VIVFGAGAGFGLPGPADLGVGVVAGLVGGGQRSVPAGVRGAGAVAGGADGGVDLPADLGDLGVCLAVDGLRAGVGGVSVSAGLVSGLQRGLGVLPGGVHRRGGCLGGLGGLGSPGEDDSGFGLGLAAGCHAAYAARDRSPSSMATASSIQRRSAPRAMRSASCQKLSVAVSRYAVTAPARASSPPSSPRSSARSVRCSPSRRTGRGPGKRP
jgi:hypothetical protein